MLYIAYAVLWLLRFALGACVFSFLGVVVWRLPRRECGEGTQSLSGVRAHAVGGGAAPVPELSPAGRQMPRLRCKNPRKGFLDRGARRLVLPVPAHTPSAARPHRRRWRSPCSVF